MVDFFRTGEFLIDVAGLVAQIQRYAVSDGFVELVGVDVGAENFQTGALVGFQERRSGEANQRGVGHEQTNRLVKFAGIGAVAFVNEGDNVSLGLVIFRKVS